MQGNRELLLSPVGQAPHQSAGCTHSMLHAHSLKWVVSLGSLSGEHNAVCSIQDSISNIAALGAGWARFLDHAFQHLEENRYEEIKTVQKDTAAFSLVCFSIFYR